VFSLSCPENKKEDFQKELKEGGLQALELSISELEDLYGKVGGWREVRGRMMK
jgi:hypothetical protein